MLFLHYFISFNYLLCLPIIACGIIGFEKFGSDVRRIFINKIVSSVCWSVISILVLVQAPDMVFYLYQPFPELYCLFNIVCRNVFVIQILLFFDAIIIFKYISIFWLKNPLNFKDDFWCVFTNVWVVIFRSVHTPYQILS